MNIRLLKHIIKYCGKAMSTLAATMLLYTLSVNQVCADQAVVLIAAKGSGIESISNRDIRRIFLGLKSADSTMVKKPVLNMHDKEIYQDFLKNVMHMTEGTYKRKLVKRIFRNGAEEIKQVDGLDALNEHLTSNVGDISFVDQSTAEEMHDIEVVKILW
jgi:hypothetical protein